MPNWTRIIQLSLWCWQLMGDAYNFICFGLSKKISQNCENCEISLYKYVTIEQCTWKISKICDASLYKQVPSINLIAEKHLCLKKSCRLILFEVLKIISKFCGASLYIYIINSDTPVVCRLIVDEAPPISILTSAVVISPNFILHRILMPISPLNFPSASSANPTAVPRSPLLDDGRVSLLRIQLFSFSFDSFSHLLLHWKGWPRSLFLIGVCFRIRSALSQSTTTLFPLILAFIN